MRQRLDATGLRIKCAMTRKVYFWQNSKWATEKFITHATTYGVLLLNQGFLLFVLAEGCQK